MWLKQFQKLAHKSKWIRPSQFDPNFGPYKLLVALSVGVSPIYHIIPPIWLSKHNHQDTNKPLFPTYLFIYLTLPHLFLLLINMGLVFLHYALIVILNYSDYFLEWHRLVYNFETINSNLVLFSMIDPNSQCSKMTFPYTIWSDSRWPGFLHLYGAHN